MASDLLVGASLVLVLVILASVLGAVKRRERFGFVAGIALFVLAHLVGAPESVGLVLAVAGIALVLASTVPLLRQPV